MLAVTAAVKALTGIGWVAIFAIDLKIAPVDIDAQLHNAFLSLLIVVSIGIVTRWKRRGGSGRTYSDGVVDGMRLAAADVDSPAPSRRSDAKVLYLRPGSSARPCTQRAPKPVTMRSSS